MWVNEDEVVTMALGESMTAAPARTNMHYRIGGIAETFMSTLLLMLPKQHRISLDKPISPWFPGLLGADKVTPRMLVANTAGYGVQVLLVHRGFGLPDFLHESVILRVKTEREHEQAGIGRSVITGHHYRIGGQFECS
jgi:CubicO group peptidase (beta-lactamase class C family)